MLNLRLPDKGWYLNIYGALYLTATAMEAGLNSGEPPLKIAEKVVLRAVDHSPFKEDMLPDGALTGTGPTINTENSK